MSGFFYNLGKMVGPQARKGKWLWKSMTGSEADIIKAEYDVGQDLAHEIKQQAGLAPEPEVSQLLNESSSHLTAHVTNKQRTFKFDIVKGTECNAFALPGGFIFLTRSLVDLCKQKPDEIAFILGHEMAHVIRGHAMKRIVSSSAMAAASRATPTRNLLTVWLRKVGIQFFESAYSQDRELEADVFGARLTKAAGYDPDAPVEMLSRLAELGRNTNEINIGSYFSSHPPFTTRIHNLKRQFPDFTS